MQPARELREVADLLRPHLAAVAVEIIDEIQARIPEYARRQDDTYARAVRVGVEEAMGRFLDLLAGQSVQRDSLREVYRALGAGEMREGRSLDSLQAAMRIGARVAWHRLIGVAEHADLPVRTIGRLAEATFRYLDEIAAASAEGYAEAQATEAGEGDRRRRRLLELLVADPAAAYEAVTAAAAAARWTLPRRLSVVLLDEQSMAEHPRHLPGSAMLANLDRAEPCLVLPDPESPAQVRVLNGYLDGCRAAVGPSVEPRDAVKSLRWARSALALAQRGVLAGDGVVWCDEHLATLVVFRDEELLGRLASQRLAPLAGLRDGQRAVLAGTLLAWLQFDRNANEVAARLHVHPQTVRYRLRQLDRLFGDQLRDPDVRFELEIALRAERALAPRSERS
jgi:hypothetical protein